jgi:hypothetical protein
LSENFIEIQTIGEMLFLRYKLIVMKVFLVNISRGEKKVAATPLLEIS